MGIGIKGQNICKQLKKLAIKKMEFYRRKVNSKAFDIPILTASAFII